MDTPDASRIEPKTAGELKDLNQLGEFDGSLLSTPNFNAVDQCVVKVYADRLEIPEVGLKLGYGAVSDILGGSHQELGEDDIGEPARGNRIILVRYKEGGELRKLALSWSGSGVNSLDYCEIMIYRAFAVHKIRPKNDGAPCYGILGY